MTDQVTAPADERPITQRDLQEFETRIDKKLDDWWAKIVEQLAGKASRLEVTEQLRPIQAQQDAMRETLNHSNQLSAEIKGALDALKSIHGDRVDAVNKRVDEMRIDLDLVTSSMDGLSEAHSLIRRDLYGGDGDSKGLQQILTALGLQLTSITENQNRVINSALEPLTERLGALEVAFGAIEKFVNERKRMEAFALNTGKRAWSWLASRPSSARWSAVVAAGVLVGGWLDGQPVGQLIELVVRRLLGLP